MAHCTPLHTRARATRKVGNGGEGGGGGDARERRGDRGRGERGKRTGVGEEVRATEKRNVYSTAWN